MKLSKRRSHQKIEGATRSLVNTSHKNFASGATDKELDNKGRKKGGRNK